MKKTVYFPEIFAMVAEAETEEQKIIVLHKFRMEKGFYDILKQCYDPRVKWLVTRAEIENLVYDHMDIADYDLAPTTLFLEAHRRLYNYTNIRQPPLKKTKVLRLITGMFSVLHHEEIELFKQMVDGKIEETGITEELVRKAFPGLLSEVEGQKEPEKEPEKEPVKEPEKEPVKEPEKEPEKEPIKKKVVKKKYPKKRGPKKKFGPKSKLDKHRDEIFRLINEGVLSKAAIARKFETSGNNMYSWIKRNKHLNEEE